MGDFIMLGLIGLAIILLGPVGFFLALGARARLRDLEARIAGLEARAPAASRRTGDVSGAGAAAPLALPIGLNPPPPAREPGPALAPAPPGPAAPPPARAPAPRATVAALAPAPGPAEAPVGIEERLGAHWAVIVGGVALALGALLLVKYSIEQAWFGPAARVVAGLLLSLALLVAGEYLRRKHRPDEGAPAGAPIPAVLTAAGTIAAFGSLYAAHALYGFIGPGAAFVLMGAVGLAAMLLAALHGPALAGLGLVGALGAPLLVNSTEPNPLPVVVYVAVVCSSGYGLARLRDWLWLALAAAAGAAFWQLLFLASVGGRDGTDFIVASDIHLVVETALALIAFAVAPHRATPPGEQATDEIASAVMLCCAPVAALTLAMTAFDPDAAEAWLVVATLVPAMLALAGLRLPAAASGTAAAGLVILAALTTWAGHRGWTREPYVFFATWRTPDGAAAFVGFGLAASLALAVLSFGRMLGPGALSFNKAAVYAGAGALTPLGAVSLLYLRLAHAETSSPFAATAAGLAAAMAVGAAIFRQRAAPEAAPAITLGLGALASGAIAALSLGLVFALSEGTLTVALALAALGAAFVGERLAIPPLRWCVLALGLAVAGRFLWRPRIVADLGPTILFNWLLFGYGVPALAFGSAARLMRRSGEDAPERVARALAILCSALLAFFEIRHAMNGGDPFAPSSGLVEQGLLAVTGILFSLVLMELDARRADPLYDVASLGFGALTLAQCVVGLLVVENPYLTDAPVAGGAVLNALALGYFLPAAAALALARRARGRDPEWRRWIAAIAALALLFAGADLELRLLFQAGPSIGAGRPTGDGEFYAYSALWLILALLALGYGVVARSKPARLASAALIALTVFKVFLLDLAGLQGVLRALSFLGLGVALIGVGLVYQKLIFARRPDRNEGGKPAAPGAGV
jgi:uncharacterized membrane protein